VAASTSGVHAGDDLGDRATPLSGTQLDRPRPIGPLTASRRAIPGIAVPSTERLSATRAPGVRLSARLPTPTSRLHYRAHRLETIRPRYATSRRIQPPLTSPAHIQIQPVQPRKPQHRPMSRLNRAQFAHTLTNSLPLFILETLSVSHRFVTVQTLHEILSGSH